MSAPETVELDMSAHYQIGPSRVAWYLLGYATETVYEGDYLVCDNPDCDHALSDMCWVEGDYSIVTDLDRVRACMVGDDRVEIVDVDDLTLIGEEDFCRGCGQVGCGCEVWS